MQSMNRFPALGLVLLLAASAALRFWRLADPPSQVFDEIYYARTAQEYLTGQPIYEWTHPPLSKLLIAVGVRLCGFHSWGWRVVPAAFGVLLVASLYVLGLLATGRPRVGLAVAGLAAVDSMFLVESRIAKPEIFLVTFGVLAYASGWLAVRTGRWGWWLVAGAAAGAACATKWTGLAVLATLAALVLWGMRTGSARGPWWALVLSLAVLPPGVYAASYLPHFARGESLLDVLRLQTSMYRYHATLQATHPYASPWWSWPLLLRPMWYYYESSGGWMKGIFAVGNPVVWWAVVPAVLVSIPQARHSPVHGFALVGFALNYLPYAFIGRLLFVYHFTPALPLGYLALATALERLAAARPGWVRGYWLAAALVFAYQFPVLTAYPVPTPWLRWWTWPRGWV